MTIHQLLVTIRDKKPISHPVIFFTGNSYPLLFFSQFFASLKQSQQFIVPSTNAISLLRAQLETSFLGNGLWHWLCSFDELNKSDKHAWFSYLSSYSGPHTIFCFSLELPQPVPVSWCVVQVPPCADKLLLEHILSWYRENAKSAGPIIEKLMAVHDQIPLDTAVLLVQYALVMGNNSQEFFASWLDKIIEPSNSLFTLSQEFFAKQPRPFFTYLAPISEQYVPQFWVSFWSEQLWRASAYLALMQANERADAKRISFRLPFSFLNRDWRRYSIEELKRAHNFLYDIDYQLKHGASPAVLDLFYSKFLTGGFA